jgi:hypothetical protein
MITIRSTFWAFSGVAIAIWATSCGSRNAVDVQLHAHAPTNQGTPNLEITAQVSGAQSGLTYKWFSVAGGCTPQKSDSPTTLFKFADGTTRDRVSVEIWRDGKVAGRGEIPVRLDEMQAQLVTMEHPAEDAQIEITAVPPYEPKGGPDTHAEIGGKVGGKISTGYSVVLYARASDVWYIQPTAYAAHAVRPDNTWTSWTHTGSSYAALLVKPGFEPVPRFDMLPTVGGYVVARALVDGSKK